MRNQAMLAIVLILMVSYVTVAWLIVSSDKNNCEEVQMETIKFTVVSFGFKMPELVETIDDYEVRYNHYPTGLVSHIDITGHSPYIGRFKDSVEPVSIKKEIPIYSKEVDEINSNYTHYHEYEFEYTAPKSKIDSIDSICAYTGGCFYWRWDYTHNQVTYLDDEYAPVCFEIKRNACGMIRDPHIIEFMEMHDYLGDRRNRGVTCE